MKFNQIILVAAALLLPALCAAQNHVSETDGGNKNQIQYESITNIAGSAVEKQEQTNAPTENGQPVFKRNRRAGIPVVQEIREPSSVKSNALPVAKDANGMVVRNRQPNK